MAGTGGKRSRQKGDRHERKVVSSFRELGLACERVPLSGAAGGEFSGDVRLNVPGFGVWCLEVKARKDADGWKRIKAWLGANDALVLAEDRAEPLVVLPMRAFQELLAEVMVWNEGAGDDDDPDTDPADREDAPPVGGEVRGAVGRDPSVWPPAGL